MGTLNPTHSLAYLLSVVVSRTIFTFKNVKTKTKMQKNL